MRFRPIETLGCRFGLAFLSANACSELNASRYGQRGLHFGRARFSENRKQPRSLGARCKSVAGCRLGFGGEAKLSEFRLGGVTKLSPGEALFVRQLKVPYQVHQMRNIPPCDFCAPDAIWTHQASVSVRRALWAQRRGFQPTVERILGTCTLAY